MYEILNIAYGIVPSKEQYEAIMKHYEEWPEHLGYAPYPDNEDLEPGGSGYIGVDVDNETFNGIWEVHGKTVANVLLGITATDEQIAEAQKRCQVIRDEVKGCEDLFHPDLIFIYSTS